MKVKIKTLTPIHIGTGKKLGSLEFLDNKRINYDRLFELIAEEKQEEFFEWIDQNPSITAGELIKKFQLNKGKVLNSCTLYSISGSFQQNLYEGIKDSNNEFFIPGSSLKGSLRTALLYKVLIQDIKLLNTLLDEILKIKDVIWQKFINNFQKSNDQIKVGNELYPIIDDIMLTINEYGLNYGYDLLITKIRNKLKNDEKGLKDDVKNAFYEIKKKYDKTLSDLKNQLENLKTNADKDLINKVFICGVEKEKNNKTEIVYDDKKYDLLKLVRISDTTSVSTYDNGEITELQVYALKKVPPHKSFKIYTESIKENVELEFDISIDVEFLKRAQKELNNLNSDFGKKYFIDIEQKLKNLFDIDIKNDTDFSEEKIINSIIKAWVEFGKAVSDIEKVWVDSIVNKSNTNINSLNKSYNTKNKFKVGFGSGFSGMTILSLLLKDNNLKNKAYTFYKAVGIGFHKSTNTPLNIDEFPFTRKYTNNQNIYSGFGWVKILNCNEQSEISDTDERTNKPGEQPANKIIAQIIDTKSKPPKVKILTGEHQGKETILPHVKLDGLGLKEGSKVYVQLLINKNVIQKADFKGKVSED